LLAGVEEDALRLAALVIGVRVVEGMAEGVLAKAEEELEEMLLLGICQVSTTAGAVVGELLGESDGSCIGQPCELNVQTCKGKAREYRSKLGAGAFLLDTLGLRKTDAICTLAWRA
jgi:hypothetical protein